MGQCVHVVVEWDVYRGMFPSIWEARYPYSEEERNCGEAIFGTSKGELGFLRLCLQERDFRLRRRFRLLGRMLTPNRDVAVERRGGS